MVTLYHSRGARSFRALWALEELGLPYTLHVLPFPPREQASDYLSINPAGTVPLLIDGEMRLTESAAICHYLATRHGSSSLAVAPDEPGYADYLDFLLMGEATFTIPLTTYLRYARHEPNAPGAAELAEKAARRFTSKLETSASRLLGTYLAADRFTAADISVGFALQLATVIGLGDRIPAAFAAHFEHMRARPGYRRAREAERRA